MTVETHPVQTGTLGEMDGQGYLRLAELQQFKSLARLARQYETVDVIDRCISEIEQLRQQLKEARERINNTPIVKIMDDEVWVVKLVDGTFMPVGDLGPNPTSKEILQTIREQDKG